MYLYAMRQRRREEKGAFPYDMHIIFLVSIMFTFPITLFFFPFRKRVVTHCI